MQRDDGVLDQSEPRQIAERLLKKVGDIALANACVRSYQGLLGGNLSFPLSYLLSQQQLPKDMRAITLTEGGEMGLTANIHEMSPIIGIDMRCLQNADFFIGEDDNLQDTASKRELADYYNALAPEMKIYLTAIVWALDSELRDEKIEEILPYRNKYSDLGTLFKHISKKSKDINDERFRDLLEEINKRVKQAEISMLAANLKITEETTKKIREIESRQESTFMSAADYLSAESLNDAIKQAKISKPSFRKFVSMLTKIEVLIFQSGNSDEKKEKLSQLYAEMEILGECDLSEEAKENKYELLAMECESIYAELFSPELRYLQSSLERYVNAWQKYDSAQTQQAFFSKVNEERTALLMSDMTDIQKNCAYYALAQKCEQYATSIQSEQNITLRAELEDVFSALIENITDKDAKIKDKLSSILKLISSDGKNMDDLLETLVMGKYRLILSDPSYAARLIKLSPIIANKLSGLRAVILWNMNKGDMNPADLSLEDASRFFDIAVQRLNKQIYLLDQTGENTEHLRALLDEFEQISKSILSNEYYTDLDKVQSIINLARRLSGLADLPLVSHSHKKSLTKGEAEIMSRVRNVDESKVGDLDVNEASQLLAALNKNNYPKTIINSIEFVHQYALITNNPQLTKSTKRAMLVNLLMYYKCFEKFPVNMSGCDLSGEVVGSVSRKGIIMQKSILTSTILKGSMMPGVDLKLSKCEGMHVIDGNLLDADLSHANFSRAFFNSSYLESARFDHSLLNDAIFHDSNLEEVSFVQTSCVNAEFCRVNLARTNFSGCSLSGAVFDNVVLDGAIFDKADLSGVDLTNLSFENTSMKSTILIYPDKKLDSMDWHDQLDKWRKINIPVETAFFNVLMVFESQYNVYSDQEKLEILRVLQFHPFFKPTMDGKHSPKPTLFQANDKYRDQIGLTIESMIKNLEEILAPKM